MRPTLPALLLLCGALVAQPASAGPYKYEKEYKAAVKTEAGGDVARALTMFEAIPAAERDVATRVHIASCKRKLKRYVDADRDLEALLALPGLDEAWRDTIASDRVVLAEQIARLALATSTPGLSVTVDGVAVVVPGELAVDPGAHVVVARRGDAIVFERSVEAAPGARVALTIEAPTAAPPAAPPPPAPARDVAPPKERSGVPAWPFFVAGGVLAGGFVGARFAAASAADDVDAACATQRSLTCDTDAAGAGRVRTFDVLSIVAASTAVVAIGVGVTLLVASPSSKSSASLVPSVGALNGFVVQGSF